MKKVVILILLILSVAYVQADKIVLNSPETINTPLATKMSWYINNINAGNKSLEVKYRWLDANDRAIRDPESNDTWKTWNCQDIDDIFPRQAVANCTDDQVPYPCCTGAAAGTCDDAITCFTDIFGFNIRAQDVGTSIGAGLRTLIWNQMKDDVLTPGNDGTFE